jgi:hypothetical protein
MSDTIHQPIKCRAAMLEMGLNHDSMAGLLGIERARVVRMCHADADIPPHLQHKVTILLGRHRFNPLKQPMMDLTHNVLKYLHQNGRVPLDTIKNRFGLGGRHLRAIEQTEGWLIVVWEGSPRHAFVYLTAVGYKELGLIMPIDAIQPPSDAVALTINGHDNARQVLLDTLDDEAAACLERADNIRSIRKLTGLNIFTVEDAIRTYNQLTTTLEEETIQIGSQNESNEDED